MLILPTSTNAVLVNESTERMARSQEDSLYAKQAALVSVSQSYLSASTSRADKMSLPTTYQQHQHKPSRLRLLHEFPNKQALAAYLEHKQAENEAIQPLMSIDVFV